MAKTVFRSGIAEQPGEGVRAGNILFDFAPGMAQVWGAKRGVNCRWEGIGVFRFTDELVEIMGPDAKVAARKKISFADEKALVSVYTLAKDDTLLRSAKTPSHIPEFIYDVRITGTDAVSGQPYKAVTFFHRLSMEGFPVGTIHGEIGLEVTLG